MTKINVKPDCGNSPKMLFLKDFNNAFVNYDIPFLMDRVDNHVTWNMVGDTEVSGKENFEDFLKKMKNFHIAEMTIDHIITHGKSGSVNGTMIMGNGEKYAFCDVYEFTNTKGNMIKGITSYVIKSLD